MTSDRRGRPPGHPCLLSLVGAAALTLGTIGLAGPAAAGDAAITNHEVVLSEIAIDMVGAQGPDGQRVDGTFVELMNVTQTTIELDGWELLGCDASNSLNSIVTFDSTHEIDPGVSVFFLVADDVFASSPGGTPADIILNTELDFLVQSAGGLLLEDTSDIVEDEITWTDGVISPPTNCGLDVAQDTPTDTKSIDRATFPPWSNACPTPESQAGLKQRLIAFMADATGV